MDKFVAPLLEQTGLLVMVGKAERGPNAIDAIRRNGAAYLVAVGGAAYLVSKAVRSARVVAFADLGMEASMNSRFAYASDGGGGCRWPQFHRILR